jgi:hypothetical protein
MMRTRIIVGIGVVGLAASLSAGACSSYTATDTGSDAGSGDSSSGEESGAEAGPPTDAGRDSTSAADSGAAAGDSGPLADSGPIADSSAGDAPVGYCAGQSGLTFCADFDESNSLFGPGSAGWSQIIPGAPEIGVSSALSVSPPNALFATLPEGPGGDQSAQVVELISPTSGVAQATYQFDIYVATLPVPASGTVGGFVADFQFDDNTEDGGAGSDTFGFRIGLFANPTGFDHADLEHNHPDIGGSDDIFGPIPLNPGSWNHVEMVAAFSAGSDGGATVAFTLYMNGSTAPAVEESFPARFTSAPFARIAAGMVYAFDSTYKDWGIYYDNITLKLQ